MARRQRRRKAVWTVLLAALVLATPLAAVPAPGLGRPALGETRTIASAHPWVTTWASAQQPPPPQFLAPRGDAAVTGFRDETLRQLVFTSVGGSELRVVLSNAFGRRPVIVGAATVADSAGGARIELQSLHRLSFSGRPTVEIPPGATATSDPMAMRVPALGTLAVSLFLPTSTGPATEHADAQQVNFISRGGDEVDSPGPAGFPITAKSWYFLAAVQVAASPPISGEVVALGDSLTDGFHSRLNANARWPNDLARLLLAPTTKLPMAVIDEGLAGNRLLTGSRCYGPSALARLGPDALNQPGIRILVILEGINDIGFSQGPRGGCSAPHVNVSASQIISAYGTLLARARRAGVIVVGATLTPFRGSLRWSPAAEAKRQAVNRWIRAGHGFAAVADLAPALAEPGHPEVLNPGYDSGDHIHPNDLGYQVIARVVAAALLRAAATSRTPSTNRTSALQA